MDDPQNATETPDATETPTPDPRAFDAGAQPATPSTASPSTPPVAAPDAVNSRPAVSLVPAPPAPKRGGLAGFVDSMLDDLAGTKGGAKLHQGNDGNYYVESPELSRKGQWLKIASEAIHGAAAAAGVAPGPGQKGRAFAAGVGADDKMNEDQRQQEQQKTQEARQANQDLFNAVKLKHDMAAQDFQLARLKVKAGEDDVKFAQEQQDRERALGSADLGVYKDEADLARVKEQHPDFWKDVYKNNVVAIPEVAPDGTRQGIHVYLRAPGVGSQLVDPGTPIKVFTPGKGPNDPPTLVDQVPTVPMTHDMVDAYNNAALTKYQKWHADRGEQDFKAQQTQTSEAEEEAHRATTRKTNAEINNEQPASPALVEGIGKGTIAPESLSRMLGGKEGQKLLEAVAEAHPDLDTSKLASYPKLYQDYTSGKTSQTLQNLNTAFKTVNDLTELNTYASRLPVGPSRTAWDNKLTTAAAEIANGLAKPGSTATKDEIAQVRQSLSSTFSRQSAIDKQVDSLIEQYGSIRDKWVNGAPSAAYQAKMPDLGAQTKVIMYKHDPEQASKWFGVPYYDGKPTQGNPKGRLLGFSRDGGKTLEPAQQ